MFSICSVFNLHLREKLKKMFEEIIQEIREILKKLEEIYEIKNEIDENLRQKLYKKFHQLPNSDEIIEEFEKTFTRDVIDNSEEISSNRKKRETKFLPEIEKNKKCVEIFADFGAFFNKSISKFGFKYCTESEIVRRSEISMPKIEEKKENL